MKSKQHNKSQDQNTEKLKEIPKWTRKYAQNRTLTTFVLIVIISLIAMGIGFPAALAVSAFMKGKLILAGVGIVVLVAVSMFLIIFVSKFGGKNRGLIDQKIEQRIYGKEGAASMPGPKSTKKKKWLDLFVGMIFMVCLFGSMLLSMGGYIAFKYLQPLSALYFVPFLVFLYFQQRPRLGPLLLICPILYTIHAILIVAGVPIFFTGGLCMLSISLPAFGYCFLAYAIGHLYSRYALKKLKEATRLDVEDETNGA